MSSDGGLIEAGWSPRFLDRTVGPWSCALAWVLATLVFVGLVAAGGGPNVGDADQSTVAVIAIARGDLHCAYPPDEATPTPPLYPMVAAAIVAALGLDGPTVNRGSAPGVHCRTGSNDMVQVTLSHLRRILWVGVIGWLALLAGFVALLRSAGRGRALWECLGVVVLALLTPAVETIATFFHPNDLLAMGLVLGAMACCLRSRWAWAGVLIGAACMSHQFALLVAAPLAVMTLLERRFRFVVAAAATAAVIGGAGIGLFGRGALRAIVGEGVAPIDTVTWVDHLGLSNDGLAVVARIVPLFLAAGLAVVAVRRLRSAAWDPLPFCALMAMCLGLRLVFEINLFGYRMVAYVVMLVALDWVLGRIRWLSVVFIVAVTLLWPVSSDFHSGLLGGRKLLVQLLLVVAYFGLVAPSFLRASRRAPPLDAPSPAAPAPGP